MGQQYLERVATGEKVPVVTTSEETHNGDFLTTWEFETGQKLHSLFSRRAVIEAADEDEASAARAQYDSENLFQMGFRPWGDLEDKKNEIGSGNPAPDRQAPSPHPGTLREDVQGGKGDDDQGEGED